MSTRVDRIISEIRKLTFDELMALWKAIDNKIADMATPLADPCKIFDDWEDTAVDNAYSKIKQLSRG